MKQKQKRPAVNKAPRADKASPQEWLSEACARMLTQDEPITRKCLRLASVSTDAARAFLREQRARNATVVEQGSKE